MGRFREALRVFLGFDAPPAPPEANVIPGTEMRVSHVALAEASTISGRAIVNPWRLPKAPDFAPAGAIAQDRASGGIGEIYAWAAGGAFSEGIGFLGYPYLAELSQRPEYRHVSETFAAETTRKWIKLNGDQKRIDLIEKALSRFDIRGRFRRLAELDGFFGRAQLYIDLGDRPDGPELRKPLVAAAKIDKGKIQNFKVIEPFWSYPGQYESANPLHADFYTPQFWYVMASQVHASRLLTIVGREMPDMLKPAYSFGGLSLSQMVKPYVDNWLRTRQSVSDLLHSFSTMVLSTDMSTILQGGAAKGLLDRLSLFNQTRDNRGVMAVNKDSEELTNVSTPLGTLDALLAQAQEQIASVSGIPLVVLLGVTPSGLNASSDGEIRTFYARVKSYQEKTFRSPLTTVIELIQLDIDGTVDPEITFEFIDLWEMDEKGKAEVRKSDADMDVAYVGAGVVSNEEVRARIVQDEDNPYFGMDLSADAPELPDEPESEEDFDEDAPVDNGRPGMDEWNESDHSRADNGQFGSGGTLHPVHAAAEKFREHFQNLGETVGEVDHSTNRHGEKSSYFNLVGGPRIRVSDHNANENFRVNEVSFHHDAVSLEAAKEYIERLNANTEKTKNEKQEKERQQAAYEAPFAAEFKAAKPHEQDDIITRAYPNSLYNKIWRREIRARLAKP